jgi:tetratricopeptide (TPR) repeat protein
VRPSKFARKPLEEEPRYSSYMLKRNRQPLLRLLSRTIEPWLMMVSKTRIALEFALKYKKSNSTSVFWIHASTASRIEKAYLDIAKKVKIEGWDSQDPKVDKLQLVKDWFESAPGKWTLIVDNADDIDLLYGGGARETGRSWSRLASYFPRTSNGSIILTTRNARVGTMFATIRNVLHVKALTAAESERLLTTRLGDVDSDMPSLADLANVLERVPLALVQAAAFISAESSSVAEYLELYNESDASRIKLLSDDFEDDIRDPDTKNPVAATFEISFKHIKERDPQAASVLSVMSMLDVQAIPKSLLPFDEDPVSFTKALGTLQAFSLITRRNGQSSQNEQQNPLFDLHSLVRLAMRNWLNMSNELETSMVKTMITLSKRFPPGTHESRDVWASYLPHALALLSLEQPLIRDRASPIVTPPFRRTPAEGLIAEAVLRGKVSRSLQAKGDYQSAEQMAQKSLALYEMALGGEHLDTLLGVHSLAVISQQQGRYGLAEEMSRRAVDGYKKILGNDHPYTLAAMNNLAIALGKQGNYELAEEVNRQALEGNQKVLGKDHPDTIRSISNLAVVFREQGKYGLAEEMTRQALKGYEKTLGKDHPDTLTSMNNLAVVLHIQGKYEPAEEINRRALEVRERVLGSEHPDTLQSKSDLAVVLWEQGRCEAAEEMNRKVLERSEKVLGKDHPLALTSMINMASIMLHQKLYDSAHTLSQRALSGSMNTLGSNNRITLECSRVHSSILKEAKGQPGYPGEARPTSPAIDEAQPNTIRAAIKAGHHSSQPPDTAI